MNAVVEPIAFQLPKKPRVKPKDAPPDQRKVCVMPLRSCVDNKLTDGAFRALALLCSYCNRAGITWVSQTRLAKDMGVSQQAISKHFKQLRDLGYVEIVRRGFKGERTDTLRVVFDPSISADEAIAMTSNKEDTRPPAIKEEQEKQMHEPVDPEGLKRIAKLIGSALKQPSKPKEYTMPKTGETATVKKFKEEIAKAKGKRSQPVDKSLTNHNPKVVNEEAVHSQPNHNSRVVHNTGEHSIKDSIKVIDKKELNKYLDSYEQLEVVDVQRLLTCMTHVQVREAMDTLLPLFAAEGLNPSSHILADAILQMHRDAT
jgi:DNA-binding transcriptional ArsR family regulator